MAIGHRLRSTYGFGLFLERPDRYEGNPWAGLSDDGLKWFQASRELAQKAYAEAAEQHAAEHEAARLAEAQAHPGEPYIPGAVNSLASAPPDSIVSLEEWAQRRNAAFAQRQLAAAEKQKERAAARARSHPVPGQISAGIGISVAEHLARLEAARQHHAAARADEIERRRQNRISQGRPPGTL